MKTIILAISAVAAAFAVSGQEDAGTASPGEGDHAPPPYVGSPELERLKALAGRWVATSGLPKGAGGGKERMDQVTAEYMVAANGSVVAERNFPDTPKEMISVYHDRGGKLSMTHYCALGNQPRMSLTSSSDDVLSLELVEGSLDSAEEPHMHSVSIVFDGGDEMSQTWSMYAGGEEKMTHTMTFRRLQ